MGNPVAPGTELGDEVGEEVGTALGVAVGVALGTELGDEVGEDVGDCVGIVVLVRVIPMPPSAYTKLEFELSTISTCSPEYPGGPTKVAWYWSCERDVLDTVLTASRNTCVGLTYVISRL